jgi:hypothetical protein
MHTSSQLIHRRALKIVLTHRKNQDWLAPTKRFLTQLMHRNNLYCTSQDGISPVSLSLCTEQLVDQSISSSLTKDDVENLHKKIKSLIRKESQNMIDGHLIEEKNGSLQQTAIFEKHWRGWVQTHLQNKQDNIDLLVNEDDDRLSSASSELQTFDDLLRGTKSSHKSRSEKIVVYN